MIGDVHGCYEELMELVTAIGFYEGKIDKIIFVGDLIDKGPDHKKVIEWCKIYEKSCVFVKGNHEEKHLRYHMHQRRQRKNPNYKNPMTFSDDHLRNREALLSIRDFDAFRWIDSWNDYYYCLDEQKHLILHGGLLPDIKAEDTPVKVLTRVRYLKSETEMAHIDEITADMPFWTEKYHGPEKVVFGHQPFLTPLIADHAVGIDTGCVHGNYLTAYLPYADEKFVSVKAKKVYSTLRVKSPGQFNSAWDE
jgi:serine/threonine protein phosphatase 1